MGGSFLHEHTLFHQDARALQWHTMDKSLSQFSGVRQSL